MFNSKVNMQAEVLEAMLILIDCCWMHVDINHWDMGMVLICDFDYARRTVTFSGRIAIIWEVSVH